MFVYHKDKLKDMEESGDILVFLSVSNTEEKDSIDWEDIVRYGESLDIRVWNKSKIFIIFYSIICQKYKQSVLTYVIFRIHLGPLLILSFVLSKLCEW